MTPFSAQLAAAQQGEVIVAHADAVPKKHSAHSTQLGSPSSAEQVEEKCLGVVHAKRQDLDEPE